MANSTKWVYFFGNGKATDAAIKRNCSAERERVSRRWSASDSRPAGFTITTQAARPSTSAAEVARRNGKAGARDARQARALLRKKFGSAKDPCSCLFAPGRPFHAGNDGNHLNLGLNDTSVEGLARARATAASHSTPIAADHDVRRDRQGDRTRAVRPRLRGHQTPADAGPVGLAYDAKVADTRWTRPNSSS